MTFHKIITFAALALSALPAWAEFTGTEGQNIDTAGERQAFREALELWTDDSPLFGGLDIAGDATIQDHLLVTGGGSEIRTGDESTGNYAGLWFSDVGATINPNFSNYTFLKDNDRLRINALSGDTIDLQVAQVTRASVITSGIEIASGNSLSFAANSGTYDGDNMTGDVDFTGQISATAQAASSDNAIMTRALVDAWLMDSIGVAWPISIHNNLLKATSGTGSAATIDEGGITVTSGTSTSGYGSVTLITRYHTSVRDSQFGRELAASACLHINKSSAADREAGIRFIFGNSTVAAWDADGLNDHGFGVEIGTDGTNHRIRAIAHDGTTFTAGSWVNFATGSLWTQKRMIKIHSDGSGNITATISGTHGDTSTVYTATTTGGSTSTDGSGKLRIISTNDAAGSPTSTAVHLMAARIYAP